MIWWRDPNSPSHIAADVCEVHQYQVLQTIIYEIIRSLNWKVDFFSNTLSISIILSVFHLDGISVHT